jgi:UDP-glucose 4-epimerase
MANPLLYYENNMEVTRNLLSAAVATGVEHFVFSSSAAVYGNPTQLPVSEYSPFAPVSPYGRTKAMVEQMLEDVSRAHKLRYVALRYFNVAGVDPKGRVGYPIEDQPSHLIRSAIATALGRKDELAVFGTDYQTPDGTAVRDYIHVSDLADAHVHALRYLQNGGESIALNCGYGKGRSVLEVIEAVKHVHGSNFKVRMAGRRQGDPMSIVADTYRIRHVIPDWKPRYEALRHMIKHQYDYEKNK